MKRRIVLGFVLVALAVWAVASDEITVNTYLSVVNGQFSLTRNVNQYKVTQTAPNMSYGIMALTAATNRIPLSADVAIAGYSFYRNVGTSTVYLASSDAAGAAAFLKLKTNDVALTRQATTNIYAYCGLANENGSLEWWINEE